MTKEIGDKPPEDFIDRWSWRRTLAYAILACISFIFLAMLLFPSGNLQPVHIAFGVVILIGFIFRKVRLDSRLPSWRTARQLQSISYCLGFVTGALIVFAIAAGVFLLADSLFSTFLSRTIISETLKETFSLAFVVMFGVVLFAAPASILIGPFGYKGESYNALSKNYKNPNNVSTLRDGIEYLGIYLKKKEISLETKRLFLNLRWNQLKNDLEAQEELLNIFYKTGEEFYSGLEVQLGKLSSLEGIDYKLTFFESMKTTVKAWLEVIATILAVVLSYLLSR